MFSSFVVSHANSFGNSDVYVTKVAPDGTAEWETKISANTSNPLTLDVGVCEDGAGGCVVLWTDTVVRLKAQRLDKTGAKLWGTNGVEVTGSAVDASVKLGYRVARDTNGDFVVAWMDSRNNANRQLFAQKLAASNGAAQWTANGVTIDSDTTGAKDQLQLVASTSGATIAAYRRGSDSYFVGFDSSGSVSFGPSTAITGVSTSVPWGDACSDGAGGICVLAAASQVVKVKIINSSGNSAGVTTLSNASLQALAYGISPDGSGGAICWWHERNNSSNPSTYNVRAQRVNSSGTIQWASGGVSVATSASTNQVATRPYSAVDDGSGGSICCAELPESGGAFELHVFKVDSSGTVSWDTTLDSSSIDAAINTLCSDGHGGAVVMFQTAANTAVVRAVNGSGTIQWSGETALAHDFFDSKDKPIVRGANVHAEISSPVTDIEYVRGLAANRNIRIDNDGANEDLVVTAMICSDSHISVTTTLPVTIAPGSHQTVVAHYDGSGLADATSTITSTSNTETNPELDIAVGI